MAVKGIPEATKNLNNMLKKVEGKTLGGLLAGGLVIERQAKEHVPVEHGNLKASSYTRQHPASTPTRLTVEVGFTAAYAVFVHENMEQKLKGKPRPSGLGVYWGPQGEPKFLEHAATDKSDEAVRLVQKYAKEGLT